MLTKSEVEEIRLLARKKISEMSIEIDSQDLVLVKANITKRAFDDFAAAIKLSLCDRLLSFKGDIYELSDCIVEVAALVEHGVHCVRDQVAGCVACLAYYIRRFGVCAFCS